MTKPDIPMAVSLLPLQGKGAITMAVTRFVSETPLGNHLRKNSGNTRV